MEVHKSRIQNPYTNRLGVSNEEEFFGRAQELSEIYKRIRGAQSVYLVGERRVGKSSILRALDFRTERDRFEVPEEFTFVLVDLQFIAGCTEEVFLDYVLNLISEKLQVEAGSPSRDSFARIAKIMIGHRRLVVLLDEFSVLVHNPKISPEFFAFLRSWSAKFRIPIVGAFREGLLQRITEDERTGSAFLNIFGSIYVGPFLREDAEDLIQVPASDAGLPFTTEETSWLLDLAGYFPFFLQIACYHLIELKLSGHAPDETKTLLEDAFLFEATTHFEFLFDRLPEAEKNVLTGRGVGARRDKDAEKELLRKGILIDDNGKIRVFSRIFLASLRSRLRSSSKNGYLAALWE